MYSVIVGVGNPLLGDDAVGLEVAKRLKGNVNADVKLAIAGGLELAEMIAEYDLAIIIDAFKGKGIKEIDVDDYEESVANHDISFPSAYRILSRYIRMPKVRIVGIGINGIEIKEELSPKIKKMIPEAMKKVKEILEEENELAI
ncbi:MAG: hydrogenase maturation protease [Thermoplasmata archaeon]|nr:hydrogenase maturation protease [Thermoplasmata archaeon]